MSLPLSVVGAEGGGLELDYASVFVVQGIIYDPDLLSHALNNGKPDISLWYSWLLRQHHLTLLRLLRLLLGTLGYRETVQRMVTQFQS